MTIGRERSGASPSILLSRWPRGYVDGAGQMAGLPLVRLADVDEQGRRLRFALDVHFEGGHLADLGARFAQDVGIRLGHGVGSAPENDGLARSSCQGGSGSMRAHRAVMRAGLRPA